MNDHDAIDAIAKALKNFDGDNVFDTVYQISYILGRNEVAHNAAKEQS